MNLNNSKWKRWKENLFCKSMFYEMEHHQILQDTLLGLVDKKSVVLEAGCGSAMDLLVLTPHTKKSYGLDISPDALLLAMGVFNKFNYGFLATLGSIEKLLYKPNFFDLIFSTGVLQYFKDDLKIVEELKRVVKKDGFVVVDVPYTWSLFTIKKKIKMMFGKWVWGKESQYSYRRLRKVFEKAGLEIVEVKGRSLDCYTNALLHLDYYLPFQWLWFQKLMKKIRPWLKRKAYKYMPQDILIVGKKND